MRTRYPAGKPLEVLLIALALLAGATAARALPLEITTASLPGGTAGVAYSQPIVAASGTEPYAWSLVEGALPTGLSLDGGTGEVSGTSNLAGTSDFVVLVQDAVGDTATRAFSIAIAAASPATLSIEVQPSNAAAGVAISPAVEVKVVDAFGNPVSGESVSLALIGSGSLTGGGATSTNGSGIASFTGLSVDLAGSKQLTASSGALTPVNSSSFTISAAAAATLTFEVQPSNATAGATISPAVEVKVVDAFGNAIPGESVSLALIGSGALTGGGATSTNGSGIASFAGLSVDLAGSKQLTASSGALTPVNSSSFTISAAAAATLTFEVQPSNILAGGTIAPAVQVQVVDAFTNPVAGESVSLALVGTGTLTGGGATNTNGSGIATFASLSVNLAGSKQLTASSGALTPVSSSSFAVSCPTITVDPTSIPSGQTGDAYSQTLTASGGQAPYTFAVTAGALPPGIELSTGGLLFETPTTPGSYDFTVTATDANACTGSRAYTLIVCGTVAVLPASLPDAQKDAPYSQSLSGTGGIAPYTFAVTAGTLPAGLSLSGGGLLSGTPTAFGTSNFTVTATATGGCSGATAYTLTVPTVPAAATNLAAVRLTSGNDGDGTAKLQLAFTTTPSTSTVEVYRAAFGGYPRYDDAGGSTPPTPSYPPGAPWVLTSVTASGQTDEPATRDAWSYVVFFKNSVGQPSSVSNKTPSTPNYALGDVSDGITAGAGDNLVSDLDISLLGAHYGISNGAILGASVSYLDVGPTTNLAVTSRPFTDNRIDFEDLIVFATNYGVVSAPASIVAQADAAARAAKGTERLALGAPSLVEPGQEFDATLELAGAGRIQGVSVELAWDRDIAEPVGIVPSAWVLGQNGVVLSPQPGALDAALLGVRGAGFTGQGALGRVRFRALRAGDPAVRVARVRARDAANRALGADAFAFDARAALPTRTMLLAPTPNPSLGEATLTFSLAEGGEAELAIFSVDGRRVRTLAHGPYEPGTYRFTWSGDDDSRRSVSPGVYYAQLTAKGHRYSRTLIHLH